jgi:hypothetical protein
VSVEVAMEERDLGGVGMEQACLKLFMTLYCLI